MLALIDADTPVIAAAFVSEEVSLSIAKSRLDVSISNIIRDCGCSHYKLFVSGGNNFRKEIDPSYKANRTQPSPKHREDLRQHLIKEWGAFECVGFEADDMCGIEQKQDGSTVIVAIDKDLLQVPGNHFSWCIVKKGAISREAIWQEVSEEQGWRNLFTQTLTGDVSDNIKGIKGIGKKKAEKILANCHTEVEMHDKCYNSYIEACEDDESYVTETRRFQKNLDLLWVWRELGVTYSIRREVNG